MGEARAKCRDLLKSAEAAFGRAANVRVRPPALEPHRAGQVAGWRRDNEVDLIIRLGAICPESRPEGPGKHRSSSDQGRHVVEGET